jgi:hypothetical protein
MAPEQVETPQEVDHRADIYSLGVVFYEMLTGELPLGKFQPPSNKVSIDVRLDDVVLRALAKEPERRYQQASALRTEVETIAGTQGAVSAGPGAAAATKEGASLSSAHFSRLALVGVGWAALFFVIGPLWFIPARVDPPGYPPVHAIFIIHLLELLLLALAWTAPFGTTILGWIAVAQIRRGAGKLYGLGLAVFDGLLFPLLSLDAVIGLVVLFGIRLVGMPGSPFAGINRFTALVIFTPVFFALIAIIDFLIVRLIWRAVKRSMGAQPARQPAKGKRLALVIGAGLAIPIVIIVVGLIWSNAPRRSVQYSYDWQPASLDGSVEALTGAATLRVTEVSREGQVVVVTIFSEPGFAPQQLVVSFPGPAMVSPFASADITNVDCLIAPTRNSFGQAGAGELLAGTNVLRGPGQLRIGFVFPDEAAASQAALQADQVHFGKPRGLDWNQTLCLFALNRVSGTDSHGQPVIELLNGEISLRQPSAVSADSSSRTRVPADRSESRIATDAAGRKLPMVDLENPLPLIPQPTRLEFRWVADDSDTNSPVDELPYVDSNAPRPKLRVLKEVVLDDSAVLGAALNQPAGSGSREIVVTLTDSGRAGFGDLTATNIGRQLAIVWDGRVLSAPVIRTPIRTSNISINGNFSDAECAQILSALNHRDLIGAGEMESSLQSKRLQALEAQLADLILKQNAKIQSAPVQYVQQQIIELKRQMTNAPIASQEELARDLNTRSQNMRLQALEAQLADLILKQNAKIQSAPVQYVQQQIDELKRQLTNAPAASTNELAGNLSARLDAARAILAFPERDKALAGVAHDAARVGDAAIAKRALSQITAFNSRDAAARDAARVLARDGHRAEALEIARTITSFVERDAALQELAQ